MHIPRNTWHFDELLLTVAHLTLLGALVVTFAALRRPTKCLIISSSSIIMFCFQLLSANTAGVLINITAVCRLTVLSLRQIDSRLVNTNRTFETTLNDKFCRGL